MRKFSVGLAGLVSAILLSIGMLTPGAANASAGLGSGAAAFASQAKALGLTSAQAKSLQDRVDFYLAKVGGTQVGVNKVRMPGGYVLVALPGEQTARDLDAPIGLQEACPYYYFCAYRYQNFVGDSIHNSQINMYDCTYYGMPFSGYGSFRNNQTAGTKAQFFNAYKGFITQTLGAYTESPSYNWTPVWYVKPC